MGKPAMMKVRNVEEVNCLDFSGKTVYGDWRDDLVRDGVAVIKGAVPTERAAGYVDEIHEYLESFDLGYKRDDPTTVVENKLPVISNKGMIMHYGISHEDFVWKVRCEDGVVDAFSTVYGTDDLIVSFDAINASFPNRTDLAPNSPWAHQDSDPSMAGFRCLQGLVNLTPCGSNDGGLVAMKGAHLISEEFHREFKDEPRIWQWTNEWYGFTEAGLEWLKKKGYEWEKINCEAGDLIVWDSRTPHYNVSPTGIQPRFCIYVCMAPSWTATIPDLEQKKEAFLTYRGTSHWPQALQTFGGPCKRSDGTFCPKQRPDPRKPAQLNERGMQLTGIPALEKMLKQQQQQLQTQHVIA